MAVIVIDTWLDNYMMSKWKYIFWFKPCWIGDLTEKYHILFADVHTVILQRC